LLNDLLLGLLILFVVGETETDGLTETFLFMPVLDDDSASELD